MTDWKAQAEALAEALEPFVAELGEWSLSAADTIIPIIGHPFEDVTYPAKFTVGDLRAADTALTTFHKAKAEE